MQTLRKWVASFFEWLLNVKVIPSPLDMRVGTRLQVRINGRIRTGEFRDAAPDASYAVRLDDAEPGSLWAVSREDIIDIIDRPRIGK